VNSVLPLSRRGCIRTTSRSNKRFSVLAVLVVAAYCIFAAFGASQAKGDVGDLGPPPAEPEIRQALTDLYSAGTPLGSTVDVQFNGPILVGQQPTEHANPPPRPLCVRCGYPDQGISPMYPVLAVVTVSIIYGLESSALAPSNSAETNTHNGTTCPGATQSQYCPAYYFYRDGQGNWQVA
jgi:hypothetical protein